MQTHFSPRQLADPAIAEAEAVLRRCTHCGFCLPACPTYAVLRDERDSPRGRIYLIKHMLESGEPESGEPDSEGTVAPTTRLHIDRCLSCLSCQTACPSGVDYRRLIDLARVRVAKSHRINGREASRYAARWAVSRIFARPLLFAVLLKMLRPAVWLKSLAPSRMRALLARIPARPVSLPALTPGVYLAQGRREGRVILARNCVQSVLSPQIDQAALRLLRRVGFEVCVPSGSRCCGAIAHHFGQKDEAQRLAAATIAAWTQSAHGGAVDAVVSTSAGCGPVISDYGHVLAGCAAAVDGHHWGTQFQDMSQFLFHRSRSRLNFKPPEHWPGYRHVVYHAACSLQHGQGVRDEPMALLEAAGFDIRMPTQSHLCCGAAGTYSLFQPDIASDLGARKGAALAACNADILVSGNMGCLEHLAPHLTIPAVHTVELLDWASGGPCPPAIKEKGGQ